MNPTAVERKCDTCGITFQSKFTGRKDRFRVFCSTECKTEAKLKDARENWRKKVYQVFHATQSQAKYRGREFDLTLGFVENLWLNQNGCCLISKVPFNWGGKFNPDAPSLDRIDSSRGYTQDNVRLITHHLNIAMNKFGLEQFIKLAKNVLGGSIDR